MSRWFWITDLDIRPASRRADLTTIFGFNAEGLW
jgi:hypothetical protein